MSTTSFKARVLLLDQNTGKSIGECEIISDSKEIFYTNDKPMPCNVGNIPAGTTFEKASLADILDGILYNKADPAFKTGLTFSNGDVIGSTKDNIVVKPYGTVIDDFSITTTVDYGSHDIITAILHVFTNGIDHPVTKEYRRPNKDISSVSITLNAPSFRDDTEIWLEIIDGTDRIVSCKTEYKFVSPIWVGWIRSDVLDDTKELNKATTEHYFQELIDHNSNQLEKRFDYKSNQQGWVMPGINYDTRRKLNACILIPQSWGEFKKITDINGNNITSSFAKYVGVNINTHGYVSNKYIAYVSKQTTDNDWEYVKGITYVVDASNNDIQTDNLPGDGILLNAGHTLFNSVPIDDRYWVKSYGDLLRLEYPYPGLQVYVEEINTTFRFEKGHWAPFNNKLHVVESISELTEDLGGWDDLAINATDGKIWKKRYNNQWERYGDIKAEDGVVTLGLVKEETDNG